MKYAYESYLNQWHNANNNNANKKSPIWLLFHEIEFENKTKNRIYLKWILIKFNMQIVRITIANAIECTKYASTKWGHITNIISNSVNDKLNFRNGRKKKPNGFMECNFSIFFFAFKNEFWELSVIPIFDRNAIDEMWQPARGSSLHTHILWHIFFAQNKRWFFFFVSSLFHHQLHRVNKLIVRAVEMRIAHKYKKNGTKLPNGEARSG